MDDDIVFIPILHCSTLFLDRFDFNEFPYPSKTLYRIAWRMRVLGADEDNAINTVVCASPPSSPE